MNAKPLIGVCVECRLDRHAREGFHDALLPRWLDGIVHGGGLPVLLPWSQEESDLARLLDSVEGLVVAAPRDVPLQAAGVADDKVCRLPEVHLVRLAAQRRVPFLGIGFGLHLLNLALGGSLRPVSSANGAPHRHAQRHPPRHPLRCEAGSLLEHIFGRHTDPVCSRHEAAISELAGGLIDTAWSSDGVIEAVESGDPDWFALGIQFLPEPDLLHDRERRLFSILVDEVIAHRMGDGELAIEQPSLIAAGLLDAPRPRPKKKKKKNS